MTPLGPHLTVFLREYLPSQREMSVQTSDTYAYAFQLLVCFAAKRLKITPSAARRSSNSTRHWCWPSWSTSRRSARTAPEHGIQDWPPSRHSSGFWNTGYRPVLSKPGEFVRSR